MARDLSQEDPLGFLDPTTTPQPDPLETAIEAAVIHYNGLPAWSRTPAMQLDSIKAAVRAAAPHIERDAPERIGWYARRVAALEKLLVVYRMSGARPSESLFDELALTSTHIGKQGEWLGGSRAEAVGTEERG